MIFARTATGYFQEYAPKATGINFMNRRVKFLDKDGNEQGFAPVGSVLIAYGEKALNRIANVPGFILVTSPLCRSSPDSFRKSS
jgi:hypothetical protein